MQPMTKTPCLTTALLVMLIACRPAAADARSDFMAAMQRVESLRPDLPDPPRLKAYAIYEYLVAARLRRDLRANPGPAVDADIDAFLNAHAGEPVSRLLEHDWLLSLAARGRWDWFLPRSTAVRDPRLLCARLAGRLATDPGIDLPAAAIALWLLPRRQPAECDPVFSWLHRRGMLTLDLAEERTRAALIAGDPRLALQFAAALPPRRAAPLRRWAHAHDAPGATLAAIAADPSLTPPPAASAAGFERLSRRDGVAALALLPRLLARPGTSSTLQAELRRSAAIGAALDHDPDAPAAFRALGPGRLDPLAAEWRVRAALWNGDFAGALRAIEALPPDLAALPRWRYWYARAIAATAGEAAARPLYAKIAGLRDYYGYLAADRLHRPYRLHAQPAVQDRRAQRRLAARPALIRAHELLLCAMNDEATAEWRAALAGADAATLVQAAQLAARWHWYIQSILSLKAADEWDDLRLRYPRPYRAAVIAAQRRTRVPADWILAVMRQESLFRSDAVSSADAFGLMQLQPSTAALVARHWRLPRPTMQTLFDPRTAVTLGAAYLRDLLDRYDGQLAPGLAAYNAGPAAVARWLPREPMDADIWIENIPYGETRAYVRQIIEHIVAFAWTRGAKPARLARLLPPVRAPLVEPET